MKVPNRRTHVITKYLESVIMILDKTKLTQKSKNKPFYHNSKFEKMSEIKT